MKLHILALGAHPDDVELGCGGTIAKHVAMGHQVGIVDFTRGELGTRGTPDTRRQEAADAAAIQGVVVRENLGMRDGFFQNDEEHQRMLMRAIRQYRPEVVLANAIHDRHVDHGKGAALAHDACFLSGLMKIETFDDDGRPQQAWRPKAIYHYIQSQFIEPDFIVDISGYWDVKINAIKAFKTQFYSSDSQEPETYISKPGFLKMVEARAIELGHAIGTEYGEGFTVRRFPGVQSVLDLL